MAIAEDSWVIRDLLKKHLGYVNGLEIVGIAENGKEAVDITSQLNPDILILDIRMPVLSGIDVLKQIRKCESGPVVIMFTADTSDTVKRLCLESGANYFVGKARLNEVVEICKRQMLSA